MSSNELKCSYGKDKVRVFRVVRRADGTHEIAEYYVRTLLEGAIEEAWTKSNNKPIVATDSIKNITHFLAKTSSYVLDPEKFGLELALFFVQKYAHISRASVQVTQLKWSRIPVAGAPHKHSFVRDGDEKRFVWATADATGGKDAVTATLRGGISDLLVLKTTESSFEDYLFDEFTTLKPVDDRIFSTSVECEYTVSVPGLLTKDALATLPDYGAIFRSVHDTTLTIFATHNSSSVQATLFNMCEDILKKNSLVTDVSYRLPNKHYIAVDMGYLGVENVAPKDAEVFMPISAPSGLITATVSRKPAAKL